MVSQIPKRLIAGSRGSPLALWQTERVIHALREHFPELEIELKIIKTHGDKILDLPLAQLGDKGLFTKELEAALLQHEIDFAVHSLKDLPTSLPDGLALAAMLERHDPQDVLVARSDLSIEQLPQQAIVGTGSLRRKTQLQHLRPDLQFRDLRGNIGTRLEKLERGDFDAILMAKAALDRLGLSSRISEVLPIHVMLPAVSQGVIAVETRANDPFCQSVMDAIHDTPTALCARAERALLKTLGGGCEQPIAGYARLEGEQLTLFGYLSSADGQQILKDRMSGSIDVPEAIGESLAVHLLEQGGKEILGV